MVEDKILIAEFMGAFKDSRGLWGFKNTKVFNKWHEDRFEEILPYHSNFTLLFPVIEKINQQDSDSIIINDLDTTHTLYNKVLSYLKNKKL